MNLAQRFAAWLNGSSGAAAPEEKPVKASYSMADGWLSGGRVGQPIQVAGGIYPDTPGGWREAARMVWAANAITARANAITQAPMRLYRRGAVTSQRDAEDAGDEVLSHPALDVLRRPNPIIGNWSSFRRQLSRQMSIYGEAVAVKVRPEKGKPVAQLWIKPIERMEFQRDRLGYIYRYRDTISGAQYEPEDVVRWYYPNDYDQFLAESPTSSAVVAINRYVLADLAQQGIDRRGGQGGGVIVTDFNVLAVDAERFKAEWDAVRANPMNAGRDAFLPPGTDYKAGVLTAQQQEREARMHRLKTEVFAAYAVPPAIAGDYSDASKLANADQQAKNFWQLWVVPECDMLAETLNVHFLWREWPEAEKEGLYFAHDFADVYALQSDEATVASVAKTKADRALALVGGKLATKNEARQMVDLSPLDDPAADEIDLGGGGEGMPPGFGGDEAGGGEGMPPGFGGDEAGADGEEPTGDSGDEDGNLGPWGKGSAEKDEPAAEEPVDEESNLPPWEREVAPKPAKRGAKPTEPSTSVGTRPAWLSNRDTRPAPPLNTGDGEGNEATYRAVDVTDVVPDEDEPVDEEVVDEDVVPDEDEPVDEEVVDEETEAPADEDVVPDEDEPVDEEVVDEDVVPDEDEPVDEETETPAEKKQPIKRGSKPPGTGDYQNWKQSVQALLQKPGQAKAKPRAPWMKGKAAKALALPTLMPVIDFVGLQAFDRQGNALGQIDKIVRFGAYDGMTATPDSPIVLIAGKALPASEVRVVVPALDRDALSG